MGMRERRGIGKGTLVVVLMMAMVLKKVRGGFYPDGMIFNGPEHDVLCEVFKATADLWNATQVSDKVPSGELYAGLRQALFGNYGNKKLESITEALPDEYKQAGHRGMWCGRCFNKNRYYPGRSITHDLMCLCTAGQYAEPFYGAYWFFGWHYSENGFKLCGKGREQMVPDRHHGWYVDSSKRKVARGLELPWKTVVWGCLNSWKNSAKKENLDLPGKVKKLGDAMKNFTKILKQGKGRHKLGGFEDHYTASDGIDERRIHVHYDTCDDLKKPWWKKLNEAFEKPQEQLLVDRSVAPPADNTPDAPPEGPEEEAEVMEEPFDSGESSLKQTVSTQGGEGNDTQIMSQSSNNGNMGTFNITSDGDSTYPRFEYLQSSTPITQPLWLLSAVSSI